MTTRDWSGDGSADTPSHVSDAGSRRLFMVGTRRTAFVALALLVAAGCTSTSVTGQPAASTAAGSPSAAVTTTATPTTTKVALPLDGVEACSLPDAATLPAAWQPLTTDPNPILKLGDSNCFYAKSGTGLGIAITFFRGPGRGIDSLSKTTASTPTPIDLAGRSARIYRDTPGNTCGILFDLGPDQGLIVTASAAAGSSEDPCTIVTTAAKAMVPNLPPG
jgi:hypothetical protein